MPENGYILLKGINEHASKAESGAEKNSTSGDHLLYSILSLVDHKAICSVMSVPGTSIIPSS